MLNTLNNVSSRSLSSSRYCDVRSHRAAKNGGRKHAKRQSLKEQYFPFHCLPREIIAEIFVFCLPDIEDVSKFKSKNAAPLLLCNVSSSWRSLALSIPRLWDELSIKIVNPQMNIDLVTAMADNWMARSGELPLSLRFHANLWNKRGRAAAMAHLNAFIYYASRWESVKIDLMGTHEISFPKFGPTPLLRNFSYTTPWHGLVPCPLTLCPLLSAFSWPFWCPIASNPEIPWHQLTHLTIERDRSTHEILDILRTCQMLVEFKVEIFDNRSLNQVIQPLQKPVENWNLRSFHICVYITCSVLLQSLILPALTDFSLHNDHDNFSLTWTHSVHTQLLGLFTRSRCKLEKLKLENCGFNNTGILKCLEHNSCSSLTELEIANDQDQPMFTDGVILALTDKDDLLGVNNVLLPKLSCLLLNKCLLASPGVLGNMVWKRCLWWDEDDQLKSLTLFVRDLDDTDRIFLEMAEKMGLNVTIVTFC